MKKFDSINVIPFIDIMLVMLAIVLMTASFINHSTIDVTVPKTNNGETLEYSKSIIKITVNQKGELYFQEKKISPEVFNNLIFNHKKKMFVIRMDENTAFFHFISITEYFKKHQVSNIKFVTQKSSKN